MLAIKQNMIAGRVTGVATEQAVRAEKPQVARPRHRGAVQAMGWIGVLGSGLDGVVVHGLAQHVVDGAERKAGQCDVIELEVEEPLQLARQHGAVPTGQFSQPIVRYDVSAPIGRREIGQADRGHLAQAEQLGGFKAAVAGDDLEVVGDEDRIDEAEPLDRPGNLL